MKGIKAAKRTLEYVEGVVKTLDKEIKRTGEMIEDTESEMCLATLRIVKAALADTKRRIEGGALSAMKKAMEAAEEMGEAVSDTAEKTD